MNPYSILLRPILSEKSNDIRETTGKYSFEVLLGASKDEISKAVTTLYNVKVTQVQTLVRRNKIKRRGAHLTQATKMKKAIVTLAKGSKLPLFEDQ